MHGIRMPPFVLVWLQWYIKTYKHGLAGLLHGYSVCCHCDTESMVHNLYVWTFDVIILCVHKNILLYAGCLDFLKLPGKQESHSNH